MSADKSLRNPRASHDIDEHRGKVVLYGFANWLKSLPIVVTPLTPAEARTLATELLVAAEKAERMTDR